MRAQRPEGAKWEGAARYDVTVPPEWCGVGQLAPGRRHVWVIIGKTWVEIRDSEGYIKVPTRDWHTRTKDAKELS